MKLRNLICNGLCVFLFVSDANAMSFDKLSDPGNFQYSNRANNSTMFELCMRTEQLQQVMNAQMLNFHRGIQAFESDVYTQTFALRQHFWQLEMIIEEQVFAEINAKIGEQVPGLNWPQWAIEPESEQPLFKLRQNIRQFGATFHSQMTRLVKDLQQLSQKGSHYKNRTYRRRTFRLNRDAEQFNQAVDEHLFGLHNDIKRLQSVVEEQIFELNQDVGFLKSKIDVLWSELYRIMTSRDRASWPDWNQPIRSDVYISWQILRRYIRDIDSVSDKNMRGLRQDVSSLRTFIYEDVSSLHQNARSLQMSVCGEFSYKYNRFLKCK